MVVVLFADDSIWSIEVLTTLLRKTKLYFTLLTLVHNVKRKNYNCRYDFEANKLKEWQIVKC